MTVVIRDGSGVGGGGLRQSSTSSQSQSPHTTALNDTQHNDVSIANTNFNTTVESNSISNQQEVSNDSNCPNQVASESLEKSDEDKELKSDDINITFPVNVLANLDEMINRPRWVVPVFAKGDLEILLQASYNLCRLRLDTKSEACQRFFRDGLTISFTKILTDEAVRNWKFEIQVNFCFINLAVKQKITT